MTVTDQEKILDSIDTATHNYAVAKFGQVLADCESPNFSVAQGAHEDVQAMRLNLGDSFEAFLAEATEHMVKQGLKARTFEY